MTATRTQVGKRSRAKGNKCACGCGVHTSTPESEYVRGHRPHPTLAEVWSRHVSVTDGCWQWTGYVRPAGYGQVGIPGVRRTIDAHRASWLIHVGPIPEGAYVLHDCDNKRCVRPDHLHLGGHKDNMREAAERGRILRPQGQQHQTSKLSNAGAEAIRRRYVRQFEWREGGGGWRSNARELADEFGVTPQYASQVARRLWRKIA